VRRCNRAGHGRRNDDPSVRLEALGVALTVGAAAWFGIVAATGRGSGPADVALGALFVASVATVLGASRLGPRLGRVLLGLLVSSPVLAAATWQGSHPGDPLGYSNASGALFVIAATAGLVLAMSTARRWLRRGVYAIAGLWLVVPWALGALTAALAGTAVAVVFLLLPRVRARGVLAVTGVLAVGSLVGAVALGAAYQPGPRTSPVDRVVDASIGELRVVLWNEALEMISSNPLSGAGPGRFAELSPTALAREDARWVHNEFLEVAVAAGLPAAALLVALVGWCVAAMWRSRSDPRTLATLTAFMGLVVNANLDFIWHFAEIPIGLALLVGISRSGLTTTGPAGGEPPVSREATVAVTLTVALVVVLLLPLGWLNPPHSVDNEVEATDAGLVFAGSGVVGSAVPPARLYEHLGRTGELTLEVWAASADREQDGPARIVSSSRGIIHRNLTLGQSDEVLVFRLRTTETDWNALDASIEIPGVFTSEALRHLVVTTDLETTEVFVDGERRWSGPGPGGSLDNWNHTYPLLFGNESTGDRPWRGVLLGVAIHDRVLPRVAIGSAFRRGPPDDMDGGTNGESPVARYRGGRGDRVVPDLSPAALGGDLNVPSVLPTPPGALLDSLIAVGSRPAARAVGHLALFAAWAALIAASLPRRLSGLPLSALVPVGGAFLAVLMTIVRHLSGRSPSWLDVIAALAGCAFGILLHRAIRDGAAAGAGARTPRA
jgi:O-antigen ligase